VVGLLVAGSAVAQEYEEQYELIPQTSVSTEARSYGSPPSLQHGTERAESTTAGSERSDCGGFEQRTGTASAIATSRIDDRKANRLVFKLAATASANGGHFTSCGSCIGGICIGRHGEDTSSAAAADATLVATLRFDDQVRAVDYDLQLTSAEAGGGAALDLRVLDPAGAEILHSAGSARIRAAPGAAYTVQARLQARADDRGACCSMSRTGDASIVLGVSRAPIIAAAIDPSLPKSLDGQEVKRIVGGAETRGYPTVGALLYRGAMHCSGTVVGPRTVLTAGHCLYGYDKDELTFVTGFNVYAPTRSLRVTEAVIPLGEEGFHYSDRPLADDLGLVYLDGELGTASGVHVGSPKLASLRESSYPLTFVGFGYDVVEGDLTGAGVKRQVEMPISALADRTFRYEVPGSNTCNGDSGGPAFVRKGNSLVVAGITSAGDVNCTQYGIDTRVDAYGAWIQRRIR